MRKQYPTLSSHDEIIDTLQDKGIDIFEPESKREKMMAEAMESFSLFVLDEEPDLCKEILENDRTESVGLLQGGNDIYSIYRVMINGIDDPNHYRKPVTLLLNEFYSRHSGKKYRDIFTVEKLKEYMLLMCQRRSNSRNCGDFASLGNLMFILQFGGPTEGQVRHIDNMVSNVQICLYMSRNCPSTVVYELEGEDDSIVDCKSLLEYWLCEGYEVPSLIVDILESKSTDSLKAKSYTRFFSFWKTLDNHLGCFGKLYQRVEYQHSLVLDPGSTLIAGGNEVHAGPPTTSSRMFAFAIGIPEDIDDAIDKGDCNDGEVQYSPFTLHMDFCSIIFSILDNEYVEECTDKVCEAKEFLLRILIDFLKDFTMKEYLLQIDPSRKQLIEWLEVLLDNLDNDGFVEKCLSTACTAKEIFSSPDVRRIPNHVAKESQVDVEPDIGWRLVTHEMNI
eukprot:CAMPEP_0176501248 /NCGR_PEP_ID=MMETSP0200_2-20121128/14054_1 /TAXON_ID=947934 /ORGANISM="Chaetoceros sp., Strain GSL56" /LENGTH=447 /DNA_ID=CAMNT_0017900111 /DNA_START=311 /DNA_END=1655 /DNA_ORIENTATION=+